MYTKEHIELLNEVGVLSVCLIGRKFRLNLSGALEILRAIEKDYENVYFATNHIICIKGTSYEAILQKEKRKRKCVKRLPISRWKDITKP